MKFNHTLPVYRFTLYNTAFFWTLRIKSFGFLTREAKVLNNLLFLQRNYQNYENFVTFVALSITLNFNNLKRNNKCKFSDGFYLNSVAIDLECGFVNFIFVKLISEGISGPHSLWDMILGACCGKCCTGPPWPRCRPLAGDGSKGIARAFDIRTALWVQCCTLHFEYSVCTALWVQCVHCTLSTVCALHFEYSVCTALWAQ